MLEFKKSINKQISICYYCHKLSASLDNWELECQQAKKLAVTRNEVNMQVIEELLPDGMFMDHKSVLLNARRQSKLFAGYESGYDELIAELAHSQTEMIYAISRQLVSARGTSAVIDAFIEELYPHLVLTDRVDDFVSAASDARTEHLQTLTVSNKLADWSQILRIDGVTETSFLNRCKKSVDSMMNTLIAGSSMKAAVKSFDDQRRFDEFIADARIDVCKDLDNTLVEAFTTCIEHADPSDEYISTIRRIPLVVKRTRDRTDKRLRTYLSDVLNECNAYKDATTESDASGYNEY